MKHLIKGGFVVSDGIDITKPADVLIEGDKIKSVGYSLDVKVDKITEAAGLYVYPGFICTVPYASRDMKALRTWRLPP